MVRALFLWSGATKICKTYQSCHAAKEGNGENFHWRPISLSTSINKVISRVLHDTITVVLPNIISENQVGFVKGRSINENILQAQEIIRDINLLLFLENGNFYKRHQFEEQEC